MDSAFIELLCPDKLTEGPENSVMCTINTSNLAAVNCSDLPPKVVAFTFQRAFEPSSSTVCSATYPCPFPATVATPTEDTATCGCVNNASGVITYELKYYSSRSRDAGGQFSYLFCAEAKQASSECITISDNCDTVFFGKLKFE